MLGQSLRGKSGEVPEGRASVSLPKCLREHMEESGFSVSGEILEIWMMKQVLSAGALGPDAGHAP